MVIPVPEGYGDCLTLIRSDLYRLTGRVAPAFSILLKALFLPLSHPLLWFRLSQHKGFLYPLCRVMYKLCSVLHKLDIPVGTAVGYGLYIGHGMCMVVNGGAVIGNNVNLSQFLNIGTNHNRPPVLGDCVYVAPAATSPIPGPWANDTPGNPERRRHLPYPSFGARHHRTDQGKGRNHPNREKIIGMGFG